MSFAKAFAKQDADLAELDKLQRASLTKIQAQIQEMVTKGAPVKQEEVGKLLCMVNTLRARVRRRATVSLRMDFTGN